MRQAVTLALVLTVCASMTACGSSSPSRADSADTSIVAAALAQNSVHWTELDPACSTRWTSDVTKDSGTQLFTANHWCDNAKAQMVLVNDVAYIRGNAAGLESEQTLFLPKALAKRYAGRWIAIPKGHRFYRLVAPGLTLASIVHEADPRGNGYELHLARKRWHGTRLLVLRAGNPDDEGATLSAQAHRSPLPVSFTWWGGCVGVGCRGTGSFSKWNEPVHLQPPARSTPIATVCGRCSYPWPHHG
jgi:hypothetical protein